MAWPLIVADAVLAFHLAFILFVALGALLALKWRWIPWLQLPAAAWGFYVELSGRICPLTYVENHFRAAAGESGYSGDFIGHYLLATIYPSGLTREIQYLLGALVLGVNACVYAWLMIRRRRRKPVR
ncbi:DUF2784 domain-containing protein [Dyella mobilis]|uniref:DUF2784 domain-containing protein n=1 Tax=Dyella mobilis TaxID=1849582 RepID=A0ABS2KE94_9GAMM|nr:DUF2784 domain-containing protein [Dyella mobilis]MBM7129419.1 DUF2784 domain-containing protein [Dyella mobilis]GLQ98316.1 hypothetical protein GCM10007863_27360 [Dyella mobilis]